jgi:hypothetical protein
MNYFDEVIEKIAGMCGSARKPKKPMKKMARLFGGQARIDVNRNGRVDGSDLKMLRASKGAGGKTALAALKKCPKCGCRESKMGRCADCGCKM